MMAIHEIKSNYNKQLTNISSIQNTHQFQPPNEIGIDEQYSYSSSASNALRIK